MPKKGKESRYETLIRYQRQTGMVPSELAALPDQPIDTAYIWRWFLDLHQARREGGAMIWSDIHAYMNLRGVTAAPWEVDAIIRLDLCYRVTMNEPDVLPGATALHGAVK